jgi:hypothetical protein
VDKALPETLGTEVQTHLFRPLLFWGVATLEVNIALKQTTLCFVALSQLCVEMLASVDFVLKRWVVCLLYFYFSFIFGLSVLICFEILQFEWKWNIFFFGQFKKFHAYSTLNFLFFFTLKLLGCWYSFRCCSYWQQSLKKPPSFMRKQHIFIGNCFFKSFNTKSCSSFVIKLEHGGSLLLLRIFMLIAKIALITKM